VDDCAHAAPFLGKPPATEEEIGDLVVWATLGVVLGGRLGWILFYGTFYCGIWGAGQDWCTGLPSAFLTNPLRLLEIWKGGMSFHGGLIGVGVAIWLFCRSRKLNLFMVADLTAVVTPIGLFFGRIANFVNGELPGKVTDVPWAVQFCSKHMRDLYGSECPWGAAPRHPSQLYEAFLEGILLFTLLQICLRVFRIHVRPGLITAIFFTGYGIARFLVEFFRDSESKFVGWFSMGMALSIPMWAAAAFFFWYAFKTPRARVAI
jgi:phosphatidylglycerol:prolipoprotein diacylglycerol transferase